MNDDELRRYGAAMLFSPEEEIPSHENVAVIVHDLHPSDVRPLTLPVTPGQASASTQLEAVVGQAHVPRPRGGRADPRPDYMNGDRPTA